MSEERIVALELALTAVIQTAREAGLDVCDVMEFASELLASKASVDTWLRTQAVMEMQDIVHAVIRSRSLCMRARQVY